MCNHPHKDHFRKMHFTKLLAGVPKYRSSKTRVLNRRYAPLRMLDESPLSMCPECRTVHSPWVCCLKCYQVIRDETEAIKQRMVNYNQYFGQRQVPIGPYVSSSKATTTQNVKLTA